MCGKAKVLGGLRSPKRLRISAKKSFKGYLGGKLGLDGVTWAASKQLDSQICSVNFVRAYRDHLNSYFDDS